MSTSILVASDLGPYNEQVMLQASLFASEHEASVRILHVINPDKAVAGLVVGNYLSSQLDQYSAIDDLERMVEEVKDHITGVAQDYLSNDSKIDVKVGDVVPTLLRYIDQQPSDLIVIGYSNTDQANLIQLLSSTRVPVLVVPIVPTPIQ